jgi:hypothetical protein
LSEENEIVENTAKDYLLSYLISENNVKIYEFQPIGKDLNGFEKEALQKLTKIFIIKNLNSNRFH